MFKPSSLLTSVNPMHWPRKDFWLSFPLALLLGSGEVSRGQDVIPVPAAVHQVEAIAEVQLDVIEAPKVGKEEPQSEKDLKGPLEDLAGVLEQVLKVRVVNDHLEGETLGSFNEFQQAMYSNSHLFGGGGTSSSSTGESWKMTFNWTWIHGQAVFNGGADDQSLQLTATEQVGQLKHMRFEYESSKKFTMTVWSPKTSEFTRFRQSLEGDLSWIYFSPEIQINVAGPTLSKLLRRLPAETRPQALAALRGTGFPLPPTPYDGPVVEAVIKKLCTQLPPAEVQQFKALAQGFDSDNYEERTETASRIKAQYAMWKQHIESALDDDSFSLESRFQLRAIYIDKADDEDASATDLASSLKLTQDRIYLAWLLGQTEQGVEQQEICKVLDSISPQSFGDDIAAWQAWGQAQELAAAQAADPVVTAAERSTPLETEGQLNAARSQIRALVQLKLDAQGLSIDRAHWKEGFGDKSLMDVNNEIKALIDKYHLPPNLWQGDQLANLGDAGYAVARFISLESPIQKLQAPQGQQFHPNSNTHAGNPNPNFAWNGLSFSLQTQTDPNIQARRAQMRGLQRNQQQAKPPEKYLDLQIAEVIEPYRQIRIGEPPEASEFHLGFYDPSTDFMFTLAGSNQRGWMLHHLWGNEIATQESSTIQELIADNQQLFDQQLFPLLEALGVEIHRTEAQE
jgi:hypothetical protein